MDKEDIEMEATISIVPDNELSRVELSPPRIAKKRRGEQYIPSVDEMVKMFYDLSPFHQKVILAYLRTELEDAERAEVTMNE